MNRFGALLISGFVLLALQVLYVRPVRAESINLQRDATQKNNPKWELHAGITRSWPYQEMANAYIHTVEGQVRQVATSVKTFEDWEDVYTGAVSLGIGRKLKLPILGKPISAKPLISFSYANGDINTTQSDLSTIYGVPMAYHFKQEYTFYRLEAGIEFDVFRMGPITGIFAAYTAYNWFESDTGLEVSLGAAGSQTVRGYFEDQRIGCTAAFFLKCALPAGTGWSILGGYRHEWLTLKDDTTITNSQRSPDGTVSESYTMPFEVDISGPVIGFFLLKAF